MMARAGRLCVRTSCSGCRPSAWPVRFLVLEPPVLLTRRLSARRIHRLSHGSFRPLLFAAATGASVGTGPNA